MNEKIEIRQLIGKDILLNISKIAPLLVEGFKEYPILSDGNIEYESEYLKKFSKVQGAVIAAAIYQEEIIGIASGIPLELEFENKELQKTFLSFGLNLKNYFCIAEVVIKKEHRKGRLAQKLFNACQIYAETLHEFSTLCFYTFLRDPKDPKRPSNYKERNIIWQKMGCEMQTHLTGFVTYKEIGEVKESPKKVVIWTKKIS